MKKKIMLVSPPMPSGVSIIANILLELNIRVTIQYPESQGKQPVIWQENNGQSNYVHYDEYVKLLPVLSKKKIFKFKEDIEIFWTHSTKNLGDKVIFVTRDPRSTIYSFYQRHQNDINLPFDTMYKMPGMWSSHFLHLFHLPPAETCVAYYYYWKSLVGADKFLDLKFEELKPNPTKSVHDLLKFIDIKRTDAEIKSAIENSTLSSIDLKKTTHARKGEIDEWKKTFLSEQKDYFNSEFFTEYMNHHGYEHQPRKRQNFWINDYLKALYLMTRNIKFCFKKEKFSLAKRNMTSKNYKALLISHWLIQLFSREEISLGQKMKLLYNFSKLVAPYRESDTHKNLSNSLKEIYKIF